MRCVEVDEGQGSDKDSAELYASRKIEKGLQLLLLDVLQNRRSKHCCCGRCSRQVQQRSWPYRPARRVFVLVSGEGIADALGGGFLALSRQGEVSKHDVRGKDK